MVTNGKAAPEGTRPRWRHRPGGGSSLAPFLLTAVAPVALSLFSVALSIYTLIEANREPEIWLSAPVVVKVSMKPAYDFAWDTGVRARFYLQPRFVSTARNDRVAVISDVRLEVMAPGRSSPLPFMWIEQGTWIFDPVVGTSTYSVQADPAPLVVAPNSPQLPICQFLGPPDWQWQPGTYEVTIIAERGEDAPPLRTAFAMTLSQEQADYITEPLGLYYMKVETQPATSVAFR